jgi:hypothetical protein
MLTPFQRGDLGGALFAAFPDLPTFDAMLGTINQHRQRMHAGQAAGLLEIIDRVIEFAEQEFWTPNLLTGADRGAHDNIELRKFFGDYPSLAPGVGQPPTVDHFSSQFLVGQRVFLCRQDLRTNLRNLGQGANSRVLVVTGPRGGGKTYSQNFIGYLLQVEPRYRASTTVMRYVPLDQFVDSLAALASRLGGALGLPAGQIPPRPDEGKEQDSRWMPEIFSWLTNAIQATPNTTWWLILDGFQALPQSGLDLIDRLIDHTDFGTTNLRLILLNYPQARITALPLQYQENIPSATLDSKDVEAFIRKVYALSGKTADDVLVTGTVKDIFDQVANEVAKDPEKPYRHLALLNLALTNSARRLLA